MEKIYVAVTWEECGYIAVEAKNMKEAIEKVKENSDDFSLPIEHEYIDGSFVPSTEDVDEQIAITQQHNSRSNFYKAYKELEDNLRKECDEQVKNGELTQEQADFRFNMVRDEILESMPDDLD